MGKRIEKGHVIMCWFRSSGVDSSNNSVKKKIFITIMSNAGGVIVVVIPVWHSSVVGHLYC